MESGRVVDDVPQLACIRCARVMWEYTRGRVPIEKPLRKSLQQHIEFGHQSTSIQNAFALATVPPIPFFYSKVAIIL